MRISIDDVAMKETAVFEEPTLHRQLCHVLLCFSVASARLRVVRTELSRVEFVFRWALNAGSET